MFARVVTVSGVAQFGVLFVGLLRSRCWAAVEALKPGRGSRAWVAHSLAPREAPPVWHRQLLRAEAGLVE